MGAPEGLRDTPSLRSGCKQGGTRPGQHPFELSRRAGRVRLPVLVHFQGPRSEVDRVAEHRLSRMLIAGFVPDALTGILEFF